MRRFVEGAALRRRPLGERLEGGFTVLELLVVVSVIAVLLAVTVPTFVYARSTTQERAAQADLRTALEAVNSVYIDQQSFANVDFGLLTAAEPNLRWHNDVQTSGPHTLAVDLSQSVVPNGQPDAAAQPAILMAEDAGDGTCYYVLQSDNDAPWYGKGTMAGGHCSADDAVSASSRTF